MFVIFCFNGYGIGVLLIERYEMNEIEIFGDVCDIWIRGCWYWRLRRSMLLCDIVRNGIGCSGR